MYFLRILNQTTVLWFVFFVCCSVSFFGQTNNAAKSTKLLKSVLTSVASTSVQIQGGARNIHVQQSIGQAGFTNSQQTKSNTIQQGFLNHFATFSVNNKESEFKVELNFKIYPNPVVDFFNVIFNITPTDTVYIELFDFSGKRIYTDVFAAAKSIRVPVKELSLAEGAYVMKASSGIFTNAKQVLKINP